MKSERSRPGLRAAPHGRRLRAPEPAPAKSPVLQLPAALQILATRMHAAVAVRRTSSPGTERYRRADEEVAYLNELLVRLQRRMEIPPEVWRLDRGLAPVPGRRVAVSDG